MMAITTINLSSLDGSNGFRLDVVEKGVFGGVTSVSAGDVNNDGFSDVIVGAGSANSIAGVTYVVFGKSDGFDAVFKVSSLDGSNGFSLEGEETYDVSGSSVSGAGDVNGDGFEDVIVGAPGQGAYGPFFSSSYVVFGKAGGGDAAMNLSSLDGSNGFRLDGVAKGDFSGGSVSRAGDVNGDGFDDVIIGAPDADPNGDSSGSSYIVFGKATGFDAVLSLSSLDGSNGFTMNGATEDDELGGSVSGGGDVNGDGFDDVIIGARDSGSNGNYSGSSYVVFGKESGFAATMDLSNLDGNNGFRLDGEATGDQSGFSVNIAGDVNGDGFADLIIGAPFADPNGELSGVGYVVFGKESGFAATMDLSSLDGSNGFSLDGVATYDWSGFSVSTAGDVNNDGFDDLIVNAPNADPNGENSGSSYVIFGKASGFSAALDLSSLDNNSGLRLDGVIENERSGISVGSAGDVNNDGFDDLILSGGGQDLSLNRVSVSYVVFGTNHFEGTLAYVGTLEDDIFTGTSADERFEGNDGNDTLIGRGGKDIFKGEDGDDVIEVSDLGFQTLDGGIGTDVLKLAGSSIHLNLADFHETISDMETIDLTGSGNNTMTFTLPDLFSLSGTNIFTIDGNAGDRVVGIGNGWADGGIDGNYHIFINRGTVVRVGVAVSVNSPPPNVISLFSLNGSNGFALHGMGTYDFSGSSVSNAGDVNGDGFDDVIIGARYADSSRPGSGSSYVVFGKASGFDADVDLSSLDGSNGFRLDGKARGDRAGYSVNTARDVNGDGFDDLIIGAPAANSNDHISGSSYVLFGKDSGFAPVMNLSRLNGNNGFSLSGEGAYNFSGNSVSSAGDVNGDGLADLIIGSGIDFVYVVFGQASRFNGDMNLSDLDGSNGFRLEGVAGDGLGSSVSNAGDVNGDGFDDLIVGAPSADTNGNRSGSSYVIFGKAAGFAATLDLSSLDGSNGFRLDGESQFGYAGNSVSNAGDINGDGFDDVIVGVLFASSNRSSSYVIFGKASGFDAVLNLSSIDGNNGFRLQNEILENVERGLSVGNAGDFNGDGFDDLIVGDIGGGRYSGSSYVVYGKASGFAATLDLSTLDGKNGFRLDGTAPGDRSGSSVSSAGDVNGDGFDDLIVGAPGADPNGIYNSGSSYVVFGRSNFGGGTVIPGTPGDDILRGISLAEIFEAGDGNDVLIGGGGADVFHGGAGVDQIKVPDLNFESIDGGAGSDILHLAGANLNLDLTDVGDKIRGIETICLYGRGDNTLTLTADSVLDLSDTSNTLKLHGNAGDRMTVQDDGWVDGGVKGFYHMYTHDDAVLLVGANVAVEFVAV